MKSPEQALAPAVNTFRRSMQERGVSTSLSPVHESMVEALDAVTDIIAAQALRDVAAALGDVPLPGVSVRDILIGFARGLEPQKISS